MADTLRSSSGKRAWRLQNVQCYRGYYQRFLFLCMTSLGSFSKDGRETATRTSPNKRFNKQTMVLHVHYESLYISLPSFPKQREMTKLYVF